LLALWADRPYLAWRKEHQDGHHGVEAEPFAHIGEEGDDQALGVFFEHGSPSGKNHSGADYIKNQEGVKP
jgi:hypothetical protein